MIEQLLKAVAGMVVLLSAWLLVQRLFARHSGAADEDALAGRTGCHSCHCETPCENGRAAPAARNTR